RRRGRHLGIRREAPTEVGGSLMTTLAFSYLKRPSSQDLLRVLIAGAAWGVLLTIGLTGIRAWEYGMICVDDVVATAAMSIAAGIFAIGSIALFRPLNPPFPTNLPFPTRLPKVRGFSPRPTGNK